MENITSAAEMLTELYVILSDAKEEKQMEVASLLCITGNLKRKFFDYEDIDAFNEQVANVYKTFVDETNYEIEVTQAIIDFFRKQNFLSDLDNSDLLRLVNKLLKSLDAACDVRLVSFAQMEAYYNCLLGYDSINLGDADYPEFSQGIPVEYKTKIDNTFPHIKKNKL